MNTKLLNSKTAIYLILFCILVLAAFFRLAYLPYAIGTHPDERHMVSVAMELSLKDMNPHSFAYGSFSYYIVWLASQVAAQAWPSLRSYDGVFLVGRSVCALFGLAAIVLTFLIARRLYNNERLALLAAAFLGLNFFHIQLSRYFTSDVILSTLCLAALYSMLLMVQRRQMRFYILSGVFIGLAVATKISAIILAVPLFVSVIALCQRSPQNFFLTFFKAGVVVGLSAALAFVIAEPYAILDYQSFIRQTLEQTDMARGKWRPPYTIQYANTTPYLYHLHQMFYYTMGWPLALIAISGLLFACVRSLKSLRLEEMILPVWILTFFFSTAGMQVKFPRYLLPIYPELFILGALCIFALFKFEKHAAEAALAEKAQTAQLGALSEGQLSEQLTHAGLAQATNQIATIQPKPLSEIFPYSIRLSLLGILSFLGLFACLTYRNDAQAFSTVLWTWILSWAALLLLFAQIDCKNLGLDWLKRTLSSKETLLLCATLGLALLLRIYNLENYPLQLQNDEMNSGIEARGFLSAAPPLLFSTGWIAQPNMGYFLNSLCMQIFGDNLFGLRMSGVISGVLALAALFVIVRSVSNTRLASIALLLASVYHWHLHFSRLGLTNMPALALSAWAIAFFLLAAQKRSFTFYAASGVLSAIALEVYPASYILPLLFLALSLQQLISIRVGRKQILAGQALCFAMMLFTLAPLLAYFSDAPLLFARRARDMFLFAAANERHVTSLVGTYTNMDIFGYQLSKLLKLFTSGLDTSPHYGFASMFIDPAIYLFFFSGLGICFLKSYRKAAWLAWSWLGLTVICCGILTIDFPFSPRLLGLSLLIPFFAAFSIDALYKLLEENIPLYGKICASVMLIIVVGVSAFWNLAQYFIAYPDSRPGETRDYIAREAARHPEIRTLLNVPGSFENFNFEAYHFMTPKVRGINIAPEQANTSLLQSVEQPAMFFTPADKPILLGLAPSISTNQIGSITMRNDGRKLLWYIVP